MNTKYYSGNALHRFYCALIVFWGNTGYLNYDILLENNSKIIDKKILSDDIDYLLELDLLNDFDEISELCDNISDNLSEEIFTKILKTQEKTNLNNKKYFLKSWNISNFENIKNNRWMSFYIIPEIDYINKDFFKYTGFGKNIIVFKVPLNFKYNETLGYADEKEILINSNELLKFPNILEFHK